MRVVQTNRGLEVDHAFVATADLRGHRPVGNVHQLAGNFAGLNFVARDGVQAAHHVLAGVWWLAREDLVQDSSQQVDIAGHPDPLQGSAGHFRRHVGGRSPHTARLRDRAQVTKARREQGQAPVHHQHFAEVAEHDVLGLQVAMDHAARVSERHGVRHLHKNLDVLRQTLFLQNLDPRRPLDALHRVEERARLVRAQIVDGDDIRMIEVAGYDGFGEEFLALVGVARHVAADHLDRHGAIDRGLAGSVNDAHATFADRVK